MPGRSWPSDVVRGQLHAGVPLSALREPIPGPDARVSGERVAVVAAAWRERGLRIAARRFGRLDYQRLEDLYSDTVADFVAAGREFNDERHLQNALLEGVRLRALKHLDRLAAREHSTDFTAPTEQHHTAVTPLEAVDDELDARRRTGIAREFLAGLDELDRKVFLIEHTMTYRRRTVASDLGLERREYEAIVRRLAIRLDQFTLLVDNHQLCGRAQRDLAALTAGADRPKWAARLDAHLAWCGSCRHLRRRRQQIARDAAALLPLPALAATGLFAKLLHAAAHKTGAASTTTTAATSGTTTAAATGFSAGLAKVVAVGAATTALAGAGTAAVLTNNTAAPHKPAAATSVPHHHTTPAPTASAKTAPPSPAPTASRSPHRAKRPHRAQHPHIAPRQPTAAAATATTSAPPPLPASSVTPRSGRPAPASAGLVGSAPTSGSGAPEFPQP